MTLIKEEVTTESTPTVASLSHTPHSYRGVSYPTLRAALIMHWDSDRPDKEAEIVRDHDGLVLSLSKGVWKWTNS